MSIYQALGQIAPLLRKLSRKYAYHAARIPKVRVGYGLITFAGPTRISTYELRPSDKYMTLTDARNLAEHHVIIMHM